MQGRCERLGLPTVTARVVYLDDPLRAEHDENGCRKDFTPSELVAIGRAIEEREREKAKQRQRAAGGNRGNQHTGGKPKPAAPGKVPEPPAPPVRDVVASALGVSGKTFEKAKAVVAAAERDPALAPVVEAMDRTGNVSACAYTSPSQRQSR